MKDKFEVLYRYYGYTAFRPGQEELVDGLLAGRDVFGIMPTGGGKSLCYQIPALLLEGITVVISPLISLMKDQVFALKNMGVPAAYVNSSLSAEQIRAVMQNIRQGMYKIIYVAPERLLTDRFLESVASVKLSLLAVDEAHCISQWGQDFRPSYLRIAEFMQLLPYRPILAAFTATATQVVREDVERILGLRDPLRVATGYDRPNLRFEVIKPKSKKPELLKLVKARVGQCGIVYCTTRKDVEKVCLLLQENGISATRYHAGLDPEERRDNQDDFVYDRCKVMVATNAFGMGIDKSNVSFVIHYNMPQSIEAYYQEAGRAGRDGTAADCILMHSGTDIHTAKFLIQNPGENDALTEQKRAVIMEHELRRLEDMIGYCNTAGCLRGYILDYFGQAHKDACGNCSNCQAVTQEQDITQYAKMILSCIRRIQDHLGYSLGAAMVANILHGGKEKRIAALGLDGLSTYGLMCNIPVVKIRDMITALESKGFIKTHQLHGNLSLTDQAREVLFRGRGVKMLVRIKQAEEPLRKPSMVSGASDLLEKLKALRLELAKEQKVPAYIIFNNATLRDMAIKQPITDEEFLEVSGVGQYKAERYAASFLELIRAHKSKP